MLTDAAINLGLLNRQRQPPPSPLTKPRLHSCALEATSSCQRPFEVDLRAFRCGAMALVGALSGRAFSGGCVKATGVISTFAWGALHTMDRREPFVGVFDAPEDIACCSSSLHPPPTFS